MEKIKDYAVNKWFNNLSEKNKIIVSIVFFISTFFIFTVVQSLSSYFSSFVKKDSSIQIDNSTNQTSDQTASTITDNSLKIGIVNGDVNVNYENIKYQRSIHDKDIMSEISKLDKNKDIVIMYVNSEEVVLLINELVEYLKDQNFKQPSLEPTNVQLPNKKSFKVEIIENKQYALIE